MTIAEPLVAEVVTDPDSGSRYYIHPVTQERLTSVTSILGDTEGKPFLVADLLAGKYCGTCHNGQKAFPITDCVKCHPPKQ